MIEPENAGQPGPGHNNPPSPIETARNDQLEAQEQYEARRDEIVEACDAKAIVDKISAGEAADLLKIVQAFKERLEHERLERTRPYRDAADAIMATHRDFFSELLRAEHALLSRLKNWRKEERERADAQQQEQADILGAVAKGPVDTSPTQAPSTHHAEPIIARGDYGAKAVDTKKTIYTVTDVRAVPDHILNSPTVHEAIIKVVKSMAKHIPDVPGISKDTEDGVRVR